MADDVAQASVKLVGIADTVSSVESIDVEDHDTWIDRARVVFDDSKALASQIMKEATKVQISLGWSQENAFVFEGVVMDVKTEAKGQSDQRVTLTAYDVGYLMRQKKPPVARTFTSGKLSDVVKAIVGEYASAGIALGDVTPDPDPDITRLAPLTKVQARQDWDFLQDLAKIYGARAFVEVNGNVSKFYFVSTASLLKGDPMGSLLYCPGCGCGKLIDFTYRRTGSSASPVPTATVVDPETGKVITQAATPPPAEAPMQVDPTADAELQQAADAASKVDGKPEDARPGAVLPGLASDPQLAKVRITQDPTRILGFSGEGTAVGTVKLRAKGKVTIKGISAWAEGDWYVRKVNHRYQRVIVRDSKLKEQDRSTFQSKFTVTR
jgi:hypothetical protein